VGRRGPPSRRAGRIARPGEAAATQVVWPQGDRSAVDRPLWPCEGRASRAEEVGRRAREPRGPAPLGGIRLREAGPRRAGGVRPLAGREVRGLAPPARL